MTISNLILISIFSIDNNSILILIIWGIIKGWLNILNTSKIKEYFLNKLKIKISKDIEK